MADATLVLGDLGTSVDARVRAGADFGPYIVHLVDDNNTPIDITGCEFGGEIKKTFKDRTPKAELTIAITDAVNGAFTFYLPRSITRTLAFSETVKDADGKYLWYVWLRDSTGREFPIYSGNFTVVWGSLAP